MADLGYIAAGYAATGAALVGYRWMLHERARRSRALISTLRGRRATPRRSPMSTR